jgi:hypothetical protein
VAVILVMIIGIVGVSSIAQGSAMSSVASAAPLPTCGFHLGSPVIQGAAGSALIGVPIIPNISTQSCTTSFSVTASITGSYGRPANVGNNPLASTITVTFRPNELPPYVSWEWSPHCADPASLPIAFIVSSPSGGSTQVPLTSESCAEVGSVMSTIESPVTSSPSPNSVVGIAPHPSDDTGYRTVTIGGLISAYGDAGFVGGPVSNAPIVGITDARGTSGSWCVAADGGVFAIGGAPFYGSLGGSTLNAPIVGMATTPDGHGYWLVAADGGVFSFGDAAFYGSMGGKALNAPIVGMAATPDGHGYWLVAADGGVFSFGDAAFYGSMGGKALNAPVVGMAASTTGGYWLVATDGGIFSFGGAPFFGSMGGHPLNAPISGMAASVDGGGYWLVGADNGVFAFGDAPFLGPSYYPGIPL